MLFSHSQNGVTDCKGASVGQDMWAGKCCCASTRVFPASSGAAEHARLTEQQQPHSSAEEPLEKLRDPPPILTQISVGNSGRRWAGGSGGEE